MNVTTFVKRQLTVFAALAVSAILIIVFVYAHIPTVLGFGQKHVTAYFTNGSNVYVDSNVTSRGLVIGKVDKVLWTPRGVQVDMHYDASNTIPDDARAAIHSMSAVGEIFVDIASTRAGGPYLPDGAIIPKERTSIPKQIAPVLDSTQSLLASIPNEGLQTFLDEGDKAFQNLGPSLRRLLDSSEKLVGGADEHYEQTHALIEAVGPLLDTQWDNGYGQNIQRYFADLAHFTKVAADEDPHLRGAIQTLAPAAQETRQFLQDNENTTPVLARNLSTTAHLLGVYRDALEQVLVTYPTVLAKEQRVTRGHGLTVSLVSDIWAGCTRGFRGNDLRNPQDLTDKDPVPNAFCKIPHDAQSFVRGARNIPCEEGYVGMRAATVDECFGRRPDQTPGESGQLPDSSTTLIPPSAGPQRTPLDPPDNQRNYQHEVPVEFEPMAPFGAKSTIAPSQATTWQSLLAKPLTD